jgi:hypothetical protein
LPSLLPSGIRQRFSASAIRWRPLLLCILLSAALWVALTLQRSYRVAYPMPVKVWNPPPEIHVSGLQDSILQLELSGSGFALAGEWLWRGSDTLFTSFDHYQATGSVASSFFLQDIRRKFSRDLDVQLVFPQTLHLAFERKVLKKTPVLLSMLPPLAPGYELAEAPRLQPDSVMLQGAQQVVDSLEACRFALPALPPLQRETTFSALLADSLPGVSALPDQIQVAIRPELFTELRVMLPVKVGQVPPREEVRLDCDSVLLICRVPLRSYERLRAELRSQELQIPYDELDPDFPYLLPRMSLPSPALLTGFIPSELRFVIRSL